MRIKVEPEFAYNTGSSKDVLKLRITVIAEATSNADRDELAAIQSSLNTINTIDGKIKAVCELAARK